jgi:hypothetical protein
VSQDQNSRNRSPPEEEAPRERIEEGEGTPVDRPRGRRAFSWQKLAADEEAVAARAAGASPSWMVNFDVNPVRARGVTMAPLPPRTPACLPAWRAARCQPWRRWGGRAIPRRTARARALGLARHLGPRCAFGRVPPRHHHPPACLCCRASASRAGGVCISRILSG